MKKRAFTLIELLTVIAIIAILAAIIFPVFNAARRNAKRTESESNLKAIHTALKLYHADYNAYPETLGGYVERYNNVVQRFDELKSAPLYKNRIESVGAFHSALNLNTNLTATTGAQYPQRSQKISGQYQIQTGWGEGKPAMNSQGQPAEFYIYDSYDVGLVKDNKSGGMVPELHYMLFWTQLGMAGGGKDDDPRQLGYAQPDESSVVTWDTYFRQYPAGTGAGSDIPIRNKDDIVLFLNGTIKSVDSVNMSLRGQGQYPTDP